MNLSKQFVRRNKILTRPLEILLVEDSLSDAKLISKAFTRIAQPHNLRIVSDGSAALAFLFQQGEYSTYSRPDLILLDLHLPKKDGIEVLTEIKSHPRLAAIPVIMLTASDNQQDITECYQKEANCYLLKPRNLEELEQTIQMLQNFWLEMVKLPLA